MAPDIVVKRRPHYRRDGREVRFLISRHAALTLGDADLPFFDSLGDGVLLHELSPERQQHVRDWETAGVVELIPKYATSGRPLVAIEPHMDDIALSAGGRLLLRRGTQPVVLLAATRESNVSCYWSLGRDFFDAAEVTSLREAESALAAEFAGASLTVLDRPDAPLRFQPAERWTPESFLRLHDALAPFLGFPPMPEQVRALASQLAERVLPLDPAELWIPLGLGGHIDHRLTRDACLLMIAEHWDRFASIPVLLYEDHPYSVYFPHQLDDVLRAFAARGVQLTPEVVDIGSVFDEKVRFVSIYASQFKGAAMEPNLRVRAQNAGLAGALSERAHRLGSRPVLPPESELAPDAADLGEIARQLEPWIARRASLRRITVICGAAFGPWPALGRILIDAFPNATIVVYVRNAQRWETESWSHPRVRVKPLALIAEVLRIGTPTIVVHFAPWPIEDRWRHQILKTPLPAEMGRKEAMLSKLLPWRPKIFCRHLGDVCGLLAEKI